jgi:hypothetical protein
VAAVSLAVGVGCEQTSGPGAPPTAAPGSVVHASRAVPAEKLLLRASGACLATIVRLEEHNEIPSDGDHWIQAWLKIEESSGTVPEFLRLVIRAGGLAPEGFRQEQKGPSVLRHDSLQVSERHWFVFSEDYDATKYPHQVAGWWPYAGGTVPRGVVDAVENDRFADHPVWDKALNVVYSAAEDPAKETIAVQVRDADTLAPTGVRFRKTVPGTLQWVRLSHTVDTYEMEWPANEELHLVVVAAVGELPADNSFGVPAGTYRINRAFALATGRLLAVWVAKNQAIWLMEAFQQYDRTTGDKVLEMQFDLLDSGGLAAGGDTQNWYRRIVRRYASGRLTDEQVYRHEVIKTGHERVYSSSGWLPVETRPQ